jgi:hypothetical protein
MGIIISLLLIAVMLMGMKLVWKSGFMAGTTHEAMMWLNAIDKLMPPNWQSLEINGEGMTPEQVEWANRVYASAYRLALDHIKLDIGLARQVAIDKLKASLAARGVDVE